MFSPVDSELFFSKNDPQDLRLGDLVRRTSSNRNRFSIVGYPDDEGIRLNGGRPGSATAPDLIRKILYKMTPPPQFQSEFPALTDAGNCMASNLSLADRHELCAKTVSELYKKNERVISLGGGHDYGYADGVAFIQNSKSKPLIINFDAHLDVRPNTIANHSGTPFYRLKEKFKNDFQFLEIGLQPQCNAKAHWDWALKQDIELISLETIETEGWTSVWKSKSLTGLTQNTPVYVSFDIDSLSSAEAGGCSQAWPTGLKISECMHFLKKLYSMSNVRGLGIYEVSPPYDFDFKTSKAAALLAHQFIFS